MKQLVIGLSMAVAVSLSSGCSAVITGALANAGTDKNTLQRSTAAFFDVNPRSVRISDIKNGVLGASYRANVRGKRYLCSVSYGVVDCRRPGVS